MTATAWKERGFVGRQTKTIFPLNFNELMRGCMGWSAETVSVMKSRDFASSYIYFSSLLMIKWSSPKSSLASFSFLGDVLITVTCSPKALPSLTAMCPKLPSPTTPRDFPGSVIWRYFMGLYTVIPTHSKGPAASSCNAVLLVRESHHGILKKDRSKLYGFSAQIT